MSATLDILAPVAVEARPIATSLLAIADTKLVLGNWHVLCLHNAKSLPDHAALLAMASASFGHARALYEYLGGHGLEYPLLERGRGADAIHAQALLDAPPRNWQDFVISAYLADQATWLQASRYLAHPDRLLAGLARRIGEETYFHLKYAEGWAREFARDPAIAVRARDFLLQRYPHALAWFPEDAGDPSTGDCRQAFVAAAQSMLAHLGAGGELPTTADQGIHAPAAPLLRQRPLPDGLYEQVRFKDPEAVP